MQILLAIDDSKFTAAAVQTVLIQARSYSTEIQVLQVVEPPLHSGAREMEGYDSAIHAAWEAESRQAEALGCANCKRAAFPKV